IAGGSAHSLVARVDGLVMAWGANGSGQLGDNTTVTRSVPALVTGATGVTFVAAGIGGLHSVALKSDGTVLTWGANSSGQLGDGTITQRLTPVSVSGLTGVTAIAAGSSFTLALKGDGTVWASGENDLGQLGDGTLTMRTVPVRVIALTPVTSVAAGGDHSLALTSDGVVWTWGKNGSGQLGDNTTVSRSTPTA